MEVIHKKTGNIYFMIDDNITNKSAKLPDESINYIMVLYRDTHGNYYVRNRAEFTDKFKYR